MTRWPIRLSLPLDPTDRDEEGELTDAGVSRLFGIARNAYFARCTKFDSSATEIGPLSVQRREPRATGAKVTISVGVTEVFPDNFTMAARIRLAEGGGVAADAQCSVSIATGVTDAIRDELIALAHGASHFH
jgi:acyl-CoA thioesterase FadM